MNPVALIAECCHEVKAMARTAPEEIAVRHLETPVTVLEYIARDEPEAKEHLQHAQEYITQADLDAALEEIVSAGEIYYAHHNSPLPEPWQVLKAEVDDAIEQRRRVLLEEA